MTVRAESTLDPVDDFLEHYGVKGMRWGHRKVRPDEAERKALFGPKAKKIAMGTAAVAGALAVAYVVSRSGGIKVGAGGLTDPRSDLYEATVAGKKAATATFARTSTTKLADIPSPESLMADARMAGVRNAVFRENNQRITERAWRDAANLSRIERASNLTATTMPSIDDIRNMLADPSYQWPI